METLRIGVLLIFPVGTLQGDQLRPQRENHRSLENAGVARQAAAKMRLLGNQGVPGDGPIGSGGDAGRVFQSNVTGGKLREFVVAAVSVEQENLAEAVGD